MGKLAQCHPSAEQPTFNISAVGAIKDCAICTAFLSASLSVSVCVCLSLPMPEVAGTLKSKDSLSLSLSLSLSRSLVIYALFSFIPTVFHFIYIHTCINDVLIF